MQFHTMMEEKRVKKLEEGTFHSLTAREFPMKFYFQVHILSFPPHTLATQF